MSAASQSFIDTSSLNKQKIISLFELAKKYKTKSQAGELVWGEDPRVSRRVIAMLFLEPSTRTRLSFEIAAYRLGMHVVGLNDSKNSSLAKGESVTDTILNIIHMKPDALVIRYGELQEVEQLLPHLPLPVISAGGGARAHVSQGLLDAFTILEERGKVAGERIFMFGDILHSRVAHSNFDILNALGAEVGVYAPPSMLHDVKAYPKVKVFNSIEEGLTWATVCMGLRIQLERHDAQALKLDSPQDYHAKYGLTKERLGLLSKEALILHPGPINHGVEFAPEVSLDKRSRVLDQVENGVFVRAAILTKVFNL